MLKCGYLIGDFNFSSKIDLLVLDKSTKEAVAIEVGSLLQTICGEGRPSAKTPTTALKNFESVSCLTEDLQDPQSVGE